MTKFNISVAIFGAAVLIWSAIDPYDRFTWFLEAVPGIIGLMVVVVLPLKTPLTKLLIIFVVLHSVVLFVGGHYTYARVPAGDWVSELFGLSRNHYDRFGHFAQGFFPAIFAREILIRNSPLFSGRWLGFMVICICLAFSAFYELIEWWVAVLTGSSATDFLGTQGDPWDTQWDMFCALIGSIASISLLSKTHSRQLAGLK